ncbi:MAG: M20/M25/M40 family metallo-hydrolase [Acidobacteriaceae bacterium]
MHRISFACLLVLASALPLRVFAQAPDPQSPQARIAQLLNQSPGAWTPAQIVNMERLRDAALSDPYALTELRHLTDNIGPRLAGSPQAQHAVEWVADEMRVLGATVTIEKTTVPHWVRGEETAELTAWPGMTPGTTQKIVLTALGSSVATPKDGISAPVVVVDSFAELKALPADAVKGKILLFNEHFDKGLAAQGRGGEAYGEAVMYRGAAPSVAGSLGAVATLVRSVGGADYRLPHTGMTYYSPGLPKIPAGAVTAEDADLVKNLTSQGEVRMHLTLTPETLAPVATANVIADWKGSEHPEQVVIVSGHLDSWDLATGAIDDGAGIVVSMQAIHLLQKLAIHPKRTVRFVAWMDEEQGSYGAQTYAKDHANDLQNHVGAMESDLGAGHPTGIYFQGGAALDEWLKPLSRVLAPIGAPLLERTPETGEDINAITEKGVPGFAPIQDSRYYFNYHHTAADTFDKVNPRELDENAAVMAVTAYALADAATAAPR